MRRTIIVLGIIGLLGFITFRTLFGGATISWHQRLTVIVQTPSGEVRGSSVTEITKVETSGGLLVTPEARGVSSHVRGEGVAVEILPGRWLFALLGGAGHWVYPAIIYPSEPDPMKRSYSHSMQIVKSQPHDLPVALPKDAFPSFVTFDDTSKPETVRQVKPEDFAAVFGSGVRLKAVTIELTDAAVTKGAMLAVLDWLGPYPETAILPKINPTDFSFEAKLRQGEFVRRIK